MSDFQYRTNPATGEVARWREGMADWQKVEVRTNPDTGRVAAWGEGDPDWSDITESVLPATNSNPVMASPTPAAAPRAGVSPLVDALIGAPQPQPRPSVVDAAPAVMAPATVSPAQAIADAINGRGMGWQQYQALTQGGPATTAGPAPAAPPEPSPWEGMTLAERAAEARRLLMQGAGMGAAGNVNLLAVPQAQATTERGRASTQAAEAQQQMAALESSLAATFDTQGQEALGREIAALRAEMERQRGVARTGDRMPETPASETPAYRLATDIASAFTDVYGAPDPARAATIPGQVVSAIGQIGAMLPQGPAAAGAGAGMNQRAIYDEAIAAGASEDVANDAATWATLTGTSEVIPLVRMLPRSLRGQIASRGLKRVADVMVSAFEEGGQEGLAGVLNNLTARGYYDPTRAVLADVPEQALVGAIAGGAINAAGQAAEAPFSRRNADAEAPRAVTAPQKPQEEDDQNEATAETNPPATAPGGQMTGGDAVQPPVIADEDVKTDDAGRPYIELDEVETADTGDDAPLPERERQETGRRGRYYLDTGEFVTADDKPPEARPEAVPATDAEPQPERAADATPAPDRTQPEATETATGQAGDGEAAPASSGRYPMAVLTNDDLAAVEVDPATFQYKDNSDSQTGETDRLRGVRKWDATKSGLMLVYEYADGRRVVADGHQRLGLAKRSIADGQNVQQSVLLLRERDGVSPAKARDVAAYKNIAEGSGTAIDAAKILRNGTTTAADLDLPMSSALVRDADALAKLSDDAFGMVVNEVASIRDAAAVGRAVENRDVQANILAAIGKAAPRTAFQAEHMAREMARDVTQETQDSLFGEVVQAESLYAQRAEVLDAAMAKLKGRRALLRTMTERGQQMEGVGATRVDRTAAGAQLDETTRAQQQLQILASQEGPVREALTEAARARKEGARIGDAAKQFLDAVQRGNEGARPARNGDGGARREDQARRPDPEADRGEPEGLEQPADLFGDEQSETRRGMTRRQRAEVAARQQQQKMRRLDQDRVEGDVDTLFGLGRQGDLVERADATVTEGTAKILRRAAGPTGVAGDSSADFLAAQRAGYLASRGAPQNSTTIRYELTNKGREALAAYDAATTAEVAPRRGRFVGKKGEEGDNYIGDPLIENRETTTPEGAKAHVIERGKKLDRELIIAFDANGDVVGAGIALEGKNAAGGYSVGMPPAVLAVGKFGNGAVVHHNHPNSQTFSTADILQLFIGRVQAVYAHGHAGESYRAEMTEATTAWASSRHVDDARHNPLVRIGRKIFDEGPRMSRMNKRMWTAARSAAASPEALSEAYYDAVMQAAHDIGLLHYWRSKPISSEWVATTDEAAEIRGLMRLAAKEEGLTLDNRPTQPVRLAGDLAEFRPGDEVAPRPDDGPDRPAGDQDGDRQRGSEPAPARRGRQRRGDDRQLTLLQPGPLFQKAKLARPGTSMAPATWREVGPALRKELDAANLKRVRLRNRTDVDWQGATMPGPTGFDIVIAASLDPRATLHHEVVHVLRRMDLFTPDEWSALTKKAAREWVEAFDIPARYPDLLPAEQIEEAIAEAYGAWAADRKPLGGSALERAFRKIARLFKAIRDVFAGRGMTTAEDVFGKIRAGEIGARNAETGAVRAAMDAEPVATQAAAMPADDSPAALAAALDENVALADLMNHPAVNAAVQRMNALARTDEAANFGTPEFFANRQYVGRDGKPLWGRTALLAEADEISAEHAGGPVRQERRLDILLGPPAAGKSTIAEMMALETGSRIVDADDIKKMIPEFSGGIGANAVHEESGALAQLHLTLALDRGDNIVLPKVGGSPESIRRVIALAKANGYVVNVAVMRLPPEVTMERMLRRFVSTGRIIPPQYVADIADRPTATYETLKEEGIADGYQAFDNNVPFGSAPVLLEEQGLAARAGAGREAANDRGDQGAPGSGARDPAGARQAVTSPYFRAWFGDSQARSKDGKPLILYHGTGRDFEAFSGITWGAAKPDLANLYADAAQYIRDGTPAVVPVYMRAERVFDADRLPATVRIDEFFDGIIEQADAAGRLTPEAADAIRERQDVVRAAARRNAAGPFFARHDFWNEPEMIFLRDGAQAIREALDLAGFDSIRMIENGSDTFGVLSPHQVKGVFNAGTFAWRDPRISYQRQPVRPSRQVQMFGSPAHIPDRSVMDELTAAQRGVWANLRGATSALGDRVDAARIRLQDRFLPFLRAQQALEREGVTLSDAERVYDVEQTFSGKAGRHLFEIDHEFVKPIIDLIGKTKGGLTVDNVGRWLAARHAKERNAHIRKINPNMQDAGAGSVTMDDGTVQPLTDSLASQILADAAAGPHADALREIGRLVDGLRRRSLDLRLDAGLLTPAEHASWRSQYRHYVPLKGWVETDGAEAQLDRSFGGGRYQARGPESKRALGRRSEAFNPLQAAITQAQEVAIRAEKNRVGTALYNLVSNNPAPAMWEVKTPQQRRVYNKTTGLVETMVDPAVSMTLAPNEMAVKVGGKERRIIFHDERLARAAGTVGADGMSALMVPLAKFGRYFSAINTMLNPVFTVVNAFRDMTTAQINIRGFGGKDRLEIQKAMVANWPKAFAAAIRGQGETQPSGRWGAWWQEYEKAGARVHFWLMDDPKASKAALEKRVADQHGSIVRQMAKFGVWDTQRNPVLRGVEKVNLAVDNAIRLAAYAKARDLGWSQQDAAVLAKNLTVNFNRRGEWGANLNAVFVFFNAAAQGTHIIAKAMKHPGPRRAASGLIAVGAMLGFANAFLSEEDDDGELKYDKIPDWQSEMNLVFDLVPGGDGFGKIPMPYGYNVFSYAGLQISKIARGVKEPGEALADTLRVGFNSFSPVADSTMVGTVMPTVLDPVSQLVLNEDWLGRPIVPPYIYNPDGKNIYAAYGSDTHAGPDAYKHYAGASEMSRTIAQFMNRATGGDEVTPGLVDVSPETLDHWTGFLTGGMGRTLGQSLDAVAKVATGRGDEIEAYRIPFRSKVYGETGAWVDMDRFYRFREEIATAKQRVALAEALGMRPDDGLRQLAALDKLYRDAGKKLGELRLERKRIEGSTMTAAEKREARDRLRERERAITIGANKQFIRIRGPQAE